MEAIPFFPRRIWCHEFCFLRAGSGVDGPSDLRGRRFGIPDWETTSALMTKGMLMHNYDVPLEDVTWVCAGTETALRELPGHLKIERVTGKRLEELLAAGDIDGALDPHPPQSWLRGDGVERLFPNFEAEERAYFEKTRIFPIMHTVVIKREILDRDPWVASSLFDAFAESRRRAIADVMQGPHRMLLAWGRTYLQEERQRFGRDPFAQGLKANRQELETMIQFAGEQGMLAEPLAVDELFAENTRST
jgi:4,5-dihydroxyphthalate decarboxylase